MASRIVDTDVLWTTCDGRRLVVYYRYRKHTLFRIAAAVGGRIGNCCYAYYKGVAAVVGAAEVCYTTVVARTRGAPCCYCSTLAGHIIDTDVLRTVRDDGTFIVHYRYRECTGVGIAATVSGDVFHCRRTYRENVAAAVAAG